MPMLSPQEFKDNLLNIMQLLSKSLKSAFAVGENAGKSLTSEDLSAMQAGLDSSLTSLYEKNYQQKLTQSAGKTSSNPAPDAESGLKLKR